MSDDRKQYRAQGDSEPPVRPFLSRPGEDPVPCRILDASVGGIGLHVAYENPIDLEPEEAVWLRLESTSLAEPLVTPGIVRRKTVSEGGIDYGVAFVDWLGFLSHCPPGLRQLFNQRGEFRQPFESGYIDVTVDVDEPMDGSLRDLSSYGLSFETRVPEEEVLARGVRARVAFKLPCSGGNLAFSAVVLHSTWNNGVMQCGVCFDVNTTPDFPAQREILDKYLSAREREKAADPA